MTQKKGKGRAGDDLSQLRTQLGRSTPVSQGAEPEQEQERAGASRRGNGESKSDAGGEKPRRITVDLNAERHRVLREFAFSERVKGTEVLRGLLDELADDPELATRLRERLANV